MRKVTGCKWTGIRPNIPHGSNSLIWLLSNSFSCGPLVFGLCSIFVCTYLGLIKTFVGEYNLQYYYCFYSPMKYQHSYNFFILFFFISVFHLKILGAVRVCTIAAIKQNCLLNTWGCPLLFIALQKDDFDIFPSRCGKCQQMCDHLGLKFYIRIIFCPRPGIEINVDIFTIFSRLGQIQHLLF